MDDLTGIGRPLIEQQMERILASPGFRSCEKLSGFLRFIIEETLAGRGDLIKGYTVATKVFGRPETFDPTTDPIVRIQAGRMRRRLDAYYHKAGVEDPVLIEVPKGRYAAEFSMRDSEQPESSAGAAINRKASRPTIAVLPFVCIGGTEEAQILADGITEELTVGFTRFMSLAVIARQSTLKYRESTVSIDRVAADLGARFIVTGSVRRLGRTIRVAIQLTDASDSIQLWAETMEVDLSTTGIRSIEDHVTTNVLARIGDEVGAIPRQLAKEVRVNEPESLSTYEATLNFYQYNYHVNPGSFERTVTALEKAVHDEPGYALAWAQLAEMYTDAVQLGYDGPEDPLAAAMAHASRAIDLDATCQQAHATLAYVNFAMGEYESAIASAESAIALNPNSSYQVATAAFWLGLSGKLERAATLINGAEQLNPHGPGWLRLVPLLRYLELDDIQAAFEEARHFGSPNLAWGPLLRASTAALSEDRNQATASYREFATLFPDTAEDPEPYIRAFVRSDHHADRLLQGLMLASKLASAETDGAPAVKPAKVSRMPLARASGAND